MNTSIFGVRLAARDKLGAIRHSGVSLEVVSATLGHSGLAITADVYARVGAKLQRQAADAMEGVLSPHD